MKKKAALIASIMPALASFTYAAGYLERLRGIDQAIICFIVWFTPALVVVIFALGAFLYSTGNPTNRSWGKSLMMNSLAGLLIVVAFLGISVALVPDLKIDTCINGPQEKKCADAGGQCGCPAGQVCESGSVITDVTDCGSANCCKKCVTPEKTCTEYGFVCGDCPAGQKCVISAASGCDAGKKCCQCVAEETCESLGLTCGCNADEVCIPGTEKENVGSCAKCCKCVNPCAGTFGQTCHDCDFPIGVASPCSADNCFGRSGCYFLSGFDSNNHGYLHCISCCSDSWGTIKKCEDYHTAEDCTDNSPCSIARGGWVPTDCVWTNRECKPK